MTSWGIARGGTRFRVIEIEIKVHAMVFMKYHSNMGIEQASELFAGRKRTEKFPSRPVPSRPYFCIYPACFCIYGKIHKWDGEREGMYPACICGIPFLAGIIPYFFRIYKIREKINRHTIYPLMFLNINTYISRFNRIKQKMPIMILKNNLCKGVSSVIFMQNEW